MYCHDHMQAAIGGFLSTVVDAVMPRPTETSIPSVALASQVCILPTPSLVISMLSMLAYVHHCNITFVLPCNT